MADEALSPISAKKPPVANPLAGAGAGSTLKLKPVIRKSVPGGSPTVMTGARLPTKPVVRPAAPAQDVTKIAPRPALAAAGAAPAAAGTAPEPAPKALDALKSVTQRLKGVTQEIPQQAILRKTGIIADQALTDAQKQASKARTARISLSDAIGAAPVKNEGAPMKTIRIKRPLDLSTPPPAKTEAAVAPQPPAEAPAEDEAATMITQRKTLKISRPGTGTGRAPSKLAVKKPGEATAATKLSPGGTPPAGGDEIADIADIPDMAPVAPLAAAPAGEKDVPVFVGVLSLIVQVAACAVIGALSWLLFQDCQIPQF